MLPVDTAVTTPVPGMSCSSSVKHRRARHYECPLREPVPPVMFTGLPRACRWTARTVAGLLASVADRRSRQRDGRPTPRSRATGATAHPSPPFRWPRPRLEDDRRLTVLFALGRTVKPSNPNHAQVSPVRSPVSVRVLHSGWCGSCLGTRVRAIRAAEGTNPRPKRVTSATLLAEEERTDLRAEGTGGEGPAASPSRSPPSYGMGCST